MNKIIAIAIALILTGCATGQYSQVNIGNGQCKLEEFKGETNEE